MIKPCNCSSRNREMSTYDNIRRLAVKMALSERRIYVIIRKEDGTYVFEPLGYVVSNGDTIEYIHYL